MRKLILFTKIIASVLMVTSCEEYQEVINLSLLEKSWTQSYEEKVLEEVEIYRPSDYKSFPLSRYRQIFKFYENHVCDYYVLAPNDAHYMETGSWKYNERTNVIKIFDSSYEKIYEFEIIELTDNLLKLKAIN